MSEAVVLAKVTCRQCGATFNIRWDEPETPELPIPCPLDGGATIVKVRNKNGAFVEVDQPPVQEPEHQPEPEEQPQP